MESPTPLSAAEPVRPTTTGPIRLYTSAQCISAIGSWMQKTAVGWLAWDLTHSAFWVGAVAFMDLIALLWVAPLAGPTADRRSPYRVFMTTQTLLLASALLMCAIDALGAMNILLLMTFSLINATVSGFNNPVRMTTINFLAPEGGISRAIAMNSAGVAVARSIGPAGAGLLLLHGGGWAVFAVNSVSFLAMLYVIWRFRSYIHRQPNGSRRPFLQDLQGGLAYAGRTPDISLIISVVLVFAILGRPFAEMLPAFAGDVFKGGPQTLATLMSCQGVGAIAGAAFMIRRHTAKPLTPIMMTAAFGMPMVLILFAATADLKVALPAIFLAGIFNVMGNISLQSQIQQRADPAFRGRVLSIYSLIFSTGPSLGAFLIGIGAPWLGLRVLVAAGAVLALGLMVMLSRRAAKIL